MCSKVMALNIKKITFIWTLLSTFVSCNLLCWLYIILITLSGDVDLNPGPKCKATQTLSTCHRNLNSICAHNFAKFSLLEAYVSVHKFDIIYLIETFWFQYWGWKLGNFRILSDTLWSPIQQKAWFYLDLP